MHATNLSRAIWNGIADLVQRNKSPREVYFAEVTRSDAAAGLVWTKDFGDVGVPLVSHIYSFAYYDTVPTGNATDGEPVATASERRSDPTNTNRNFLTTIVCPKKGDVVVILDPWGARRFPICVGRLLSKDPWRDSFGN